MPTSGAVFVDLDRTLIRSASGPVFQQAMEAEGVLSAGRHLPGDSLMYGFYNRFGETVPFIGLARAAVWIFAILVAVDEESVKGVTCGVSAPANGATGVCPGGVKITFGNESCGHEAGVQLKVCW